MSKKWNEVNSKLETLTETIKLLSHPWESQAETTRKATILASDVAQNITKSGNFEPDTNYSSTTYNQIQQLKIPAYMSWDYWVMINQWVDYWINRYSNFKHEQKELILAGVRIAIMYGLCGIDKETFQPYYIIDQYTNSNSYEVIDANIMFNSSAVSIKNKNLYITDKAKIKKISKNKLILITWRFNNIGDFVWCMKPLLTDIYLKKIIECNCSHLTNKIFYKVKNPNNLPLEISVNSNPFSNFGVIVSDEGTDIVSNSNTLFDRNKTIGESHIVDLITAYKHHQEYYYNLFGRVITSSKNQSLSSDANLSVSSAELVADEHDRRIKDALAELGINIEIKEVETNQQPQNQNSDKYGEGYKNTNMETVEEKA